MGQATSTALETIAADLNAGTAPMHSHALSILEPAIRAGERAGGQDPSAAIREAYAQVMHSVRERASPAVGAPVAADALEQLADDDPDVEECLETKMAIPG